MKLVVNGASREVDSPPLTPLLFVLREELGITSPKAGCQQCGFCTSGFLMATYALLQRTPNPSRKEIEHALSGHVCRCTGYVKILEAVEAAASGKVGEERLLPESRPGEPGVLVPGSPA